jgi:hypothetical protein
MYTLSLANEEFALRIRKLSLVHLTLGTGEAMRLHANLERTLRLLTAVRQLIVVNVPFADIIATVLAKLRYLE